MNTLADIAVLVAIFSTAIIYGTDLFCALILRPAASGASDASVADLLGRVHEYGDRRLPLPGVLSIIATALASATNDSAPARIGGALALAALLLWLAIYLRISAPINKRLRAAAANPEAARSHWERAMACYAGECVPGATRVRNHLMALERVAG